MNFVGQAGKRASLWVGRTRDESHDGIPDEAQMAQRRAAFAGLAKQHAGALQRAACRVCCGDDDRADDLTQETLVRAYEAYAAGQFGDVGHTRAWLLRILTNLYINDYRRQQKWDAGVTVEALTAHGEGGPEATHAPASDRPGVALLADTLDEPLERALASLPDGLRLSVLLVDVEGLDYAAAAAALDIPVGTVRSRLSRARPHLHDLLVDYAHDRRLL